MQKRRILLAAWLLSATVALLAQSSDASGELAIVVVVNKANPAAALGANELRPIFQTRMTSWGSGGEATPLNLPSDNKLRQDFDRAVLGLDPDRAARYWQDRKIRGGAHAPKQLASTSAVLAVVAADPSAVGYVPLNEANKTVKVIAKIVGGRLLPP
jgi:ABC-type phosphate transport system substrate-binding protein